MKQPNRFYLSPILNAFLFSLIILIGGVCVSSARADTATLTWDTNTETDLAGYKLYYGSSTGSLNGTGLDQGVSPIPLSLTKIGDVRNPKFVLTGLAPNQTYQFAVTAYNTAGLESGFSNTITVKTSTVPVYYTITATAGSGGGISPTGVASVPQGGTQKYEVTPAAGNMISDVVVNGASVGPVTSYTFTNVTKNCTINAKFAAGSISVGNNLIPKTAWTLHYTDSQELTRENGAAVNAFDGNPSTIWHTLYYPKSSVPPHEIQINLGTEYLISGFQYLPRQDGYTNGTIKQYAFYVSADGKNWGTAVASGIFAGSATQKAVSFSAVKGRFIRLAAQSEVNGGAWTSVAELDVLGVLSAGSTTASYAITTSIQGQGTISPSGTTSVKAGGSQAYIITPSAGNRISDVVVNGASVGPVTSYTFTNVTKNCTIDAKFAAGSISVGNNLIPKTAWTLHYTDSQELTRENGAAVNAFDGNPSTIWHTLYYPKSSVPPHEIQINLGTEYLISGFQYLPRQDGYINGTIKQYAFYVSADGKNWGTAVASGIFAGSVTQKAVSFSAVKGRFIRLAAQSEVNGGAWTSIAELDVLGVLSAGSTTASYAITTSIQGQGTISPSGTTSVKADGSQAYIITPSVGNQISDVVVNGASVGAVTSYTFTNINKNSTILAKFGAASYTITASSQGQGALSPSGVVSVTAGAGKVYTITPSAGNQISDVVVNGASVGAVKSYTFTNINKDSTILAKFGAVSYTITASSQGQGILSPSGVVSVTAGASKAYTITPNAGNQISDVVVNGASVGAVKSYTFTNINKDSTILAKFAANSAAFQMEAGEVSVDHNWKRVNFTRKYTNPVVVATSLSENGTDPAVVRIDRVDNTGFEISVQEWEYLDVSHMNETIGYLVVEAGHHTLPNGTMVEAGYVKSDQTETFEGINFVQKFNVTPVVMAAATTFNDPDALTVRLNNVNANGFDMMLQEEEASDQVHEVETIAFIAWEPYRGDVAGFAVEVASTGNVVTSDYKVISFQKAFNKIPSLVAGMQSFNGENPADTRWLKKSLSWFQIKVAEEQSADQEIDHYAENVGYMAFAALP